MLVPAAASAAGANGTFFRSDITIVNFAVADQRVQLRWLPQPGAPAATQEITIHARETITSDDFVKTFLGIDGLGALLITAITADGAIDPNGKLWVSSHVWTNVPGTDATVAQSMDPVPLASVQLAGGAIFGSRRDAQHRVNVGIVNLDTATQVFLVQAFRPGTSFVEEQYGVAIPPMSMQQITLARSTDPIGFVRVGGKSGTWFAYSSSVDNTTGGAWTEFPVPLQ